MKLNIVITGALAVLCVAGAAGKVQADEADVHFSTGTEFSTGTYGGTEDIEEVYVPFTLRLGYDRLGLRFTVPWLRVGEPGAPTESGMGDVIASATIYDVFVSDYGNFVIDLTGKIKFGTADEQKGLGTGENDYTLQVEAARFFERHSLQGAVGYRLRGEPPGVPLDDVLLGWVGGYYRTSPATSLGLFYDFRESALSGTDDIQELSGSVSYRINDSWRVEVYAFTGFGDMTADWGAGLFVTTDLRLFRGSDRY
jgi:hypothetical protein